MLTKIVLIDPTMYKSDMDEFIKIFPEMFNHFTKKENYFVYNNELEINITYEQFDAIDDMYNCVFTNNSFVISNEEF